MRLGFAGTPEFAVPALDALSRKHQICGVFTQPDRPAGRGQALHASPIKHLATRLGVPVHQPARFSSPLTLEILQALDLDALVVAAYGLILPPAALSLPRLGCINIHASLLPRWRGAAPIQRALLAGDARTGVTIMQMDEGLDTGPMLSVREIAIGTRDNAKSVHDRLSRIGADLIGETLVGLQLGRLSGVPQPAGGASYAPKITKAEAMIDWRLDAAEIWRRVRAFNPWPIAETRLDGAQLRIWDAEMRDPASRPPPPRPGLHEPGAVLAATAEGIDVACGGGELRILRLQLAGRRPLQARDFIRGQRLDSARFASA